MNFKLIFILLISAMICKNLLAQNKIAYNFGSEVGNEISRAEADKYGLFPGFSEFISAKFYELRDGGYQIDIKYVSDGQVKEQVWYITRQEFTEDYLQKMNRNYVVNKQVQLDPDEQQIKLLLENETSFRGRLIGIQDYSLQLLEGANQDGPIVQIPVNRVTEVSILRRQNPGKAVLIGLIPGAVIGLVGFLSGDDEPGFLSFSRKEKAAVGFLFGGFIGINIGGTIAAMRSVDFDIPLEGQTQEDKLKTFNSIYERNAPKRMHFRINPWFAFHVFRDDRYEGSGDRIVGYMPGIRAKIYFTPRSGLELSYGRATGFNKEIKYYSYEYDPVSGNYLEKYDTLIKEITYFSGGYFIALTRNNLINPTLSWGWGYHNEKNSDLYDENDESLVLHFKIGVEHHFNRWLSFEARFGPVTNFNRVYLTGEFGISLGTFY